MTLTLMLVTRKNSADNGDADYNGDDGDDCDTDNDNGDDDNDRGDADGETDCKT